MNSPFISAIIPAFNSEKFLGECIESVLAQTHPVLEILVVDDGSDDETSAVARSFGDRVTLIRQANAGVSVARNRALDVARGEFIAPLDADDVWLPEKTALQMEVFRQSPELDLLFAHMQEFDVRRDQNRVLRPPEPAQFAGTSMIRRAVFERVGLFRPGLKIAEWLDWCLRVREANMREYMMPEVVTYRRIHGNNASFVQIDQRPNLVRTLKESLDRRRAGGSTFERSPT